MSVDGVSTADRLSAGESETFAFFQSRVEELEKEVLELQRELDAAYDSAEKWANEFDVLDVEVDRLREVLRKNGIEDPADD